MDRYEKHIKRKKRDYEKRHTSAKTYTFCPIINEVKLVIEEPEESTEDFTPPRRDFGSKKGIPQDNELILLYNTGKGNQDYIVKINSKIDTVRLGGLDVDRYRRVCLRCNSTFIGYEKFNRVCPRCSNLALKN